MKLWLLRPVGFDLENEDSFNDPRWGWDCTFGVIVAAGSEAEARQLAGTKAGDEDRTSWLTPNLTTCVVLADGVDGPARVVMVDFNAG